MKRSTAVLEVSTPASKKNINTGLEKLDDHVRVGISVDCVIFGFDENELKVLLIKCDLKKFQGYWSLLGDLVGGNEDIEQAAYRVLLERTGLDDLYLEQVKTFGEVDRHPPPVLLRLHIAP
jgi:8-oxo-dGTP diphosphatase